MKREPRGLLFSALGVAALACIWTAVSLLAGAFFVPPPWTTLRDTLLLLVTPSSWIQIGITLLRVTAGFFAALTAGTLLGMAAGRRYEVESMIRPITLFIQGIPPLLWAIPVILVLGTGYLSPILVIALICYPLIVVNVVEGMKTVPKPLEEMLEVFAPGRLPRLREIVLPYLRPFYTASLRLGIILGIKASVVGEYFGANDGIGFQVQAAFQTLQIRRLFSWGMVLIAVILFASFALTRILGGRKASRSGILVPESERAFHNDNQQCTDRAADAVRSSMEQARHSSALRLEGISFTYLPPSGTTPTLLHDVTLRVDTGEVAVIHGESGVGKTTLLKIIGSILQPVSGSVTAPANVGIVFQDDRLIPWRSVLRNVAVPVLYRGYTRREVFCLARELLADVGLSGWEQVSPDELSGGMRKRVALARCFARFPELTLLDEPFSNLDKPARRSLWDQFFSLIREFPGPAVIMTHFPEELEGYPGCVFYELGGSPATLRPARPA
jgi:ABC-type nitrate/sulfonate/bicarbonate transport system ATPase subunit/ABC-type nitrate/sulfonate/bicarbonate transport system permease component